MIKYVFSVFVFLLMLVVPVRNSSSGEIPSEYRKELFEVIEEEREATRQYNLFLDEVNKYANYNLYLDSLAQDSIDYCMFKEILSRRESNHRYDVVNRWGYMGRYQFGKTTLRELRRLKLIKFDNEDIRWSNYKCNIPLQEASLAALTYHNYDLLKPYFKYVGEIRGGVEITKEGMLAAAHLRGYRSVVRYLATNGRINRTDAYGTSVGDYLGLYA